MWLIPIVTFPISAWLAWDRLSKRGPTITNIFDGGEGPQAGSRGPSTGTLTGRRKIGPDHVADEFGDPNADASGRAGSDLPRHRGSG
jgi:hypothetical protein